ncbi:hypothetical protein A9Q99_11700 [Gammaproteobacteria bacterium 45_16_T64]|nr:hypothetical protein A9Q99_11700 [Gammaproteobacteria bacterium 45_16_T64]
MTKPIYRRYEDKDSGAIVELVCQLGYEHSTESIRDNVKALRENGSDVFVVEIGGDLCGCISAIIDIRLAEGIKGEIVSLVVSESVRGQGLGKGLVVHAEKWLSNYVKEIRVRANALRVEAHQFYQELGYTETKQQRVLIKII